MTPEQRSKLPKFAQEYITKIERERDISLSELNDHLDNQTPSQYYSDDYLCVGEQKGPSLKRKYFQTHKMTVLADDVELSVYIRDGIIELQWSGPERNGSNIAMIPKSYQMVELVPIKRMRK